MTTLGSEALELKVHPEAGFLEVFDRRGTGRIRGAGVHLRWQRGSHPGFSNLLEHARVSTADLPSAGPKGADQGLMLLGSIDTGLKYGLQFALAQDGELLCWRAWVENHGDSSVGLDQIVLLAAAPQAPSARGSGMRRLEDLLGWRAEDLLLFTQGWQSWSAAGIHRSRDVQVRTRLGPLAAPMMISPLEQRTGGRRSFASEPYGSLLHRKEGRGLLLGFLTQQQAFGNLRVDFRVPGGGLWLVQDLEGIALQPGRRFVTDWAVLLWMDLGAPRPEDAYLRQAAAENRARIGAAPIAGWCSWYQYGQAIDQAIIRENLSWLAARRADLPLDVFQIDDGYAPEIGDWLELSSKFPLGMDGLAAEIRRADLQPGLWMAPFLVRPGSQLLAEHGDWVLRDRRGRPVRAGYVWGGFPRALDVTHPGVLDALAIWTETAVHCWGFPYLKLDFLYAGGLPGERRTAEMTGAQALRQALEVIRTAAGDDCHLVGCGCPLGSGIGIFDSMRIGPDVGPHWRPRYKPFSLFLRCDPSMPSARNAIRNMLLRLPLHRRWWLNDPDCLILREEGGELSPGEVEALATAIALTSETMMLSDRLLSLPAERVEWLKKLWPPLLVENAQLLPPSQDDIYQIALPLSGPVGEWTLLAVFNLADQDRRVLPAAHALGSRVRRMHAVDYWQARYNLMDVSDLKLVEVLAHGVRLLAIRPITGAPQWVGDTLHISQGQIVRDWSVSESKLEVALRPDRAVQGQIWLELPAQPEKADLDGTPVRFGHVSEDIYRARVDARPGSVLRVHWQGLDDD